MGFTRRDRKDLAVLGLWVWALLAFGPVLHLSVPHSHARDDAWTHALAHAQGEAHDHGEAGHTHGAFDPSHGAASWLQTVTPEPPSAQWLDLGLAQAVAPRSVVVPRWRTPVMAQAP